MSLQVGAHPELMVTVIVQGSAADLAVPSGLSSTAPAIEFSADRAATTAVVTHTLAAEVGEWVVHLTVAQVAALKDLHYARMKAGGVVLAAGQVQHNHGWDGRARSRVSTSIAFGPEAAALVAAAQSAASAAADAALDAEAAAADAQAAAAQIDATAGAAVDAAMAAADLAIMPGVDAGEIAFAVVDEGGRRTWIESGYDGSPTAHAAAKIAEAVGPEIGLETQDEAITGLAFAVVDEDGRRTEIEVGEDGRFTDRVVDSMRARIDASGPDITCWGDSMTAGSYPTALATLTGRTVHNRGIGGENSITIAHRAGGYPLMVTVVGGSIPASGIVEVVPQLTPGASAPGAPLKSGSTNQAYAEGRIRLLDGTWIVGTLSRTASPDRWYFTRAVAGAAIPVARPVPYEATELAARRNDITILWIGQNGPDNERAIRDAKAIIRNLTRACARWLVIPKPTSTPAEDARWFEEFGGRAVLIREYLVQYGLADAGITPTPQDEIDMTDGKVPVSLRTDPTHWTAAGLQILAEQIHLKMIQMGWL